jgi:hypothetical protein
MKQVAQALDQRSSPLDLFFRDDDAGWATAALGAMIDLFDAHDCPVDLAVIPAVLDDPTANQLNRWRHGNARIGLHQHGYAHVNHEPTSARKCEFGAARPIDRQCADIMIGRDRMAGMLGETDAIFTPPWNRCSPETVARLGDMGFAMFSSDQGDDVDALTVLPVTLDWDRARREDRLEAMLTQQITHAASPVGIMLHHATLDDAARLTLGEVLGLLKGHQNVRMHSMRHWIGETT